MNELKKIIGNKLREAREEAGLNQSEVAELLRLKRSSSYGHIEAGRNWLQIEHLLKLSDYYHKPITFFLGTNYTSLSPDESELLHLYRALPPGLDQYALAALRAWAGLRPELRPEPAEEPVEEPGQEAAAPPAISEEKLAEWQEDIEVINLYLATYAATPERRNEVMLFFAELAEREEAGTTEEMQAAFATEQRSETGAV